MTLFVRLMMCVCLFTFLPFASQAQDEISEIPFDTLPGNTTVNGGGATIALEGDTNVTGSVDASGEVSTSTGVRFPDASVQTTAAAGASTTANAGLYANTIADFTPPNAYTEICIKDGDVFFDIHGGSEPTAGGNCLPGDVGWIIERFERAAGTTAKWFTARLECLKAGMRLPELFEWSIACDDAATFAISNMEDNWEWTGNRTIPGEAGMDTVLGAALAGNGGCDFGGRGNIKSVPGQSDPWHFRCAR